MCYFHGYFDNVEYSSVFNVSKMQFISYKSKPVAAIKSETKIFPNWPFWIVNKKGKKLLCYRVFSMSLIVLIALIIMSFKLSLTTMLISAISISVGFDCDECMEMDQQELYQWDGTWSILMFDLSQNCHFIWL